MYILPQITQITQRNAASCIISQRKTVCEVSVVLGFICVNQRDLRETLGFLLCGLIEYSCVYSPADSADHAEECSRLHYIAEKDSSVRLRLFCCSSAIICVICERHWGFFCVDRLSTLM